MRSAGLMQVDCNWRWRGFALLVGQRPAIGEPARLSIPALEGTSAERPSTHVMGA